MRSSRRPAAVLALALLLPAAPGGSQELASSGEGWITGKAALTELVSDRTHYRDRSDGSSEVEYQAPDGRSAYLWDNCVERGQWWVTEQEVCFFYPDTALQGPHCFRVKRNGKQQIEFWWSGDPLAPLPTATTVDDRPGNAERLPLGVTGECVMS